MISAARAWGLLRLGRRCASDAAIAVSWGEMEAMTQRQSSGKDARL